MIGTLFLGGEVMTGQPCPPKIVIFWKRGKWSTGESRTIPGCWKKGILNHDVTFSLGSAEVHSPVICDTYFSYDKGVLYCCN